jgi:hypothetical protein
MLLLCFAYFLIPSANADPESVCNSACQENYGMQAMWYTPVGEEYNTLEDLELACFQDQEYTGYYTMHTIIWDIEAGEVVCCCTDYIETRKLP